MINMKFGSRKLLSAMSTKGQLTWFSKLQMKTLHKVSHFAHFYHLGNH